MNQLNIHNFLLDSVANFIIPLDSSHSLYDLTSIMYQHQSAIFKLYFRTR